MTFRARNSEGAQAIHINRFSFREDGWGVYDRGTGSCEVVINTGTLGDGNLALSVQAGSALLDGNTLAIEEQSIDVPQALSEPRKDVIGLTENGAVFRAGGDQALKQPDNRTLLYSERPAPPDLLEDRIVPLAIVAIPADAESISTNELADIRPSADYQVGTLNGTDPADYVTSDELEDGSGYLSITGGTLTGSLTIDSGDQSSFILANNGDNSLRLRTLSTGEIYWSVFDSNGTIIGNPFEHTETDGLTINDPSIEGDLPVSGTVSAPTASISGTLNASSAALSSTGANGGLSMGSGIRYSRDITGRAVIYSASSDGGDGWAFRDPDGTGDSIAIEPNGDTTVNGSLDANDILKNGTPVLDAVDILSSGSALGSATSLNFATNLAVSITDGEATIDATADGDGTGAIAVSDDGTAVGDASEFNFTDNITASVSNGVADIAGSGTGGTLGISNSGTNLDDASQIDFGNNLSVSVNDGIAYANAEGGDGSGDSTGYTEGGYTYGGYGTGVSSGSITRAINFGADPSGDTSSTAALQEAINSADEGETVVWGATGTYYLDGEILIDKPIDLNLDEGIIESDYHDETSYTEQNHYYPLFRVQGSLGEGSPLAAPTDRGEDQVHVSDPGNYSVGDGVILRTESQSLGTPIPGPGYMATQTRIRDIQNGVIYLEDNALWDYDTSDYITVANYVRRPIIRNLTITNRRPLSFDDTTGKVLGGPRHAIATEVCDNPLIENCTVEGYDSHLWTSRDDMSPEIRDCEARKPMNLSGSCGEPIHIQSSRDVAIVRPAIKEARRGIDVRSGCGKVTVEEPDITGISLVGISWHDTSTVASDIEVNGGRVECKPDDPTMENKDGSLSQRQELQQGIPFNTGVNGTLISKDVDYVGRINASINGPANIRGGELFKYRNSGTVLTLNGEDIDISGMEISSLGAVDRLVATEPDTDAKDVEMRDIHFDCSGGPARVVEILQGENITITGHATSGAGRIGEVEAGTDITFDFDCVANGDYVYTIYGGENVTVKGSATGSVGNSQVHIGGGTGVQVDANLQASSETYAQGVRIFGGSDIDITGVYRGPAVGVRISGNATGVSIHDMRIEVTDTGRDYAIGTDTSPTSLNGVKLRGNDLRGSVDSILMNVDVTGLWAVDNACSSVDYTAGTTVGQVAGNMIY